MASQNPQPPKNRPPRDRHTAVLLPGPTGKWGAASKIITMHKLAARLSDNPRTRPADFWAMLKSLDTASAVRGRLDRAEVEKTPRDQWKPFLDLYVAACVTGMASNTGILEPLERSGIVSFGRRNGRKCGACAPQPLDESSLTQLASLPALGPVGDDIPQFNPEFTKMLAARLRKALACRNLLPAAEQGESGLKTRIALFHQQLSVGMLFGETRVAIGQYLRQVEKGRDPVFLDIVASKKASFVFPWLLSLGILEDMVNELLGGGAPGTARGAPKTDGMPDIAGPDDGIDGGLFGPEQDDD